MIQERCNIQEHNYSLFCLHSFWFLYCLLSPDFWHYLSNRDWRMVRRGSWWSREASRVFAELYKTYQTFLYNKCFGFCSLSNLFVCLYSKTDRLAKGSECYQKSLSLNPFLWSPFESLCEIGRFVEAAWERFSHILFFFLPLLNFWKVIQIIHKKNIF